jgi:hypothetical protein
MVEHEMPARFDGSEHGHVLAGVARGLAGIFPLSVGPAAQVVFEEEISALAGFDEAFPDPSMAAASFPALQTAVTSTFSA